jgi:hypothetical protein
MNLHILNGAMNRTDEFLQDDDAGVPMQGTNMALPMDGTNQAFPMNSTNAVIPMNGAYGEYYVSPLSLIDPEDVPMQGVPDDFSDSEISHYQLAYMVGDPDAMQGLFKNLREKRKQAKAGNKGAKLDRQGRRNERRAARAGRRADKDEARDIRRGKAARGEGFLDKFGGALTDAAAGFRARQEAARELEAEGIDFDENILDERVAMMAEDGEFSLRDGQDNSDDSQSATGIAAQWAALSMPAKVGIGLAGAAVAYGIYKMATKKKGRK